MNISVLYTMMVLLEQGDNTQKMPTASAARELSIVVLPTTPLRCRINFIERVQAWL